MLTILEEESNKTAEQITRNDKEIGTFRVDCRKLIMNCKKKMSNSNATEGGW